MKIQKEIETRINNAFDVAFMSLENESYMHNVPEGSESHFKLVLVSDAFQGKRPVQRHQLVYSALQEQMVKIHALAIHAYTLDEWQKHGNTAPLSPKCHGGER